MSFSLLWLAGGASANPAGGTVVDGAVTFAPNAGVNLDVGIHSQRAIIDWQSFSIQLGETARFNFDSASGAVLNRVTTIDPANLSLIAGRLESNGQVILLNPNGILVAPSGVVDTRSFIGTTLSLDPAEFMSGAGRFTFEGSSDGSIINHGLVLAREKEGLPGGDVVLIARTVRNDGAISAQQGRAGLAAGTRVTLYDTGDQRIVVETGAPDAEVVNGPEGVIAAVTAELKAAGGNIGALAINNEGVIRANTIVEEGGRVFLRASRGTVVNSGTIEAAGTAPGATGGHVEITGDQVLLAAGSAIDASGPAGGGTILVGGDFHGTNPDVPNALNTTVEAGAGLRADAESDGDGGKVVVWADGRTEFRGHFSARGAGSGAGGVAEVSGASQLSFSGGVDLFAEAGRLGTLLLDPAGDTVVAAVDPADGSSFIDVTSINGAGANVAIDADVDVFFNADVVMANDGVGITARAGNNVVVNNSITTRGGSVSLSANNDFNSTASGTGGIILSAPIDTSANAQTDGAITLAVSGGSGVVAAGSNLTSGGGAGDITVNAPLELSANTQINSEGADVNFLDAINADDATSNDRTLEVNAGTGTATFSGNIGAGANGALADLDVTASAINLDATLVRVNDSGGNTVTFDGAVVLGANLVVDSDGAADNAVEFTGTIERDIAARDLTVNAGSAAVTLAGEVGSGANPLGNVALNTTGVGAVVGSVNSAGVTTDGGGTTSLGGDVTTSGAQAYGDDVVLSGDVVLTGTTPTFGGSVTGANHDLTLNFSGGTVIDGAVITGVNDLASGGGGTTTLQGGITTTGAQTYGDDVSLNGAVTLAGTTVALGGNVVGGNNALGIVGSVVLGDATVDTVTGLTTLTVDGNSTINAGVVISTGNQEYDGTVTLAGGDTTSLVAPQVGVNGDIVGGGGSLSITGDTTLGDAQADSVGGLSNLSVTGATILNAGSVTTSGNQDYTGGLTLAGGDKTLTGATPTFGGSVTGANHDLTLNFSGTTVIDGAVITGVNDLASGGGTTTLQGGITTTGAQTYDGAVVLGGATTVTSGGAGDISFNGTVNGAQTLVVNTAGTTTFGGAVGGGTALAGVTTDGGGTTSLGGDVTTSGAQAYGDDVVLSGSSIVASSGSGAISFNGTVNGAQTLAVNTAGATTFGGVVGGATALTSLGTGAGGLTTFNGGAVTTSGLQTYGDLVVLGANTAFGASALLFTGGLDANGFAVGTITAGDQVFNTAHVLSGDTILVSTAGRIEFVSTVDSDGTPRALTINTPGETIFGGAVGTLSPLQSLTTDAPGQTVLNGGQVTAVQSVDFQDPVVLGADTTVAANTVTFASTVNAAAAGIQGLTINADGVTILGDEVGGLAALRSVTTDGPFAGWTEIFGNVTTTGEQFWGDSIFADGNLIGDGIVFAGGTFGASATFNGTGNQSIDAGTGSVVAGNVVRKTTVGDLTIGADGGIVVGDILLAGLQVQDGSLTVSDALTTGGVGASQNISLVSINTLGRVSATGGNVAITGATAVGGSVSAGGAIYLGGPAVVGGNVTAGATVQFDAAGDVDGNISAGGSLVFGGPANVGGGIGAEGVTFNEAVVLDGGTDQIVSAGSGVLTAVSTLTKTGTGSLTLAGNGGVNVTGNLTVTPAGGSLTVSDNLAAGAAVSAPQNITLGGATSSAVGDVTTTTGNLTAGMLTAANLNIGGNLSAAAVASGGNVAVAGLTTVSGTVTAGNNIALNGAATLGDHVTAGNGITFGGAVTLNGAGEQNLNAGAGTLFASATVDKMGVGGLGFLASEIDLVGGPDSVNGTGVLSIQTTHPSGRIGLGDLTVGNTPDRLDLSAADVAALGAGFADVIVGDLANTREIRIGTGAFFDAPLTLRVDALEAANTAIAQDLNGSLRVVRLSLTAIGQVLLGNAGAGAVPDALQPANQIGQLGDVSVTGSFYLQDSGSPVAYTPTEIANSPFFLDPNLDNRRGLDLVGDFVQSASGVQTVIRTAGDLNLLPGASFDTGDNNLTVLSAEVPSGGSFLANFHNAGATDINGDVVPGSVDGISLGTGSQLLVYSSDANFNTFQRGAGFDVNNSAQNGVQPVGGEFHFGRIVISPAPGENFKAVFGQVIAPNVFTLAPGLGDVQFVVRSANVPAPPEASKFVFFDFAPEPFAGITLDTQSFRTGISRPGTEIRTHSSLLYDFEEWNRQGRPARPPASPEPGIQAE